MTTAAVAAAAIRQLLNLESSGFGEALSRISSAQARSQDFLCGASRTAGRPLLCEPNTY